MALKPYYTSDDIVDSITRKIGFPLSQQTFTPANVLSFVNEEMMMSQVPSVLMYHEEYFVVTTDIALEANVNSYQIPKRAIGMKLRDLFYKDQSGNLIEMTRISPEERSQWDQNNVSTGTDVRKYYLQGNDIILVPRIGPTPTGSLTATYFLRPNQLVPNVEAAIIANFSASVTIANATLTAGDTITIDSVVFTAVSGSPSTNEFQIGATSILSASNLVVAINTNGVVTASNGSPATAIISLTFDDVTVATTSSNSTAIAVSSGIGLDFTAIPSTMTAGTKIDILQADAGHKTYNMDVKIPTGSISGTTITFNSSDISTKLEVGDYIALAGECIIPQIPSDLHSSLADRSAVRILESIGDREASASLDARIAQQDGKTGTIIDTRVEGSIPKVVNSHGLLRYNKRTRSRRF